MELPITKDGRTFSIRRPTEDDAADIITYSKILFASTDQVLTAPGEYKITVEDEKVWITNFNLTLNALLLIADLNSQVVGMIFFMANAKLKNAHTGEFGVSVHPHFQGIGIGRLLIKTLLTWARENKQIEKIYLNVFATKRHAIKLYRDLGFVEEGRHIKAAKQPTGQYVDIIQMYHETK